MKNARIKLKGILYTIGFTLGFVGLLIGIGLLIKIGFYFFPLITGIIGSLFLIGFFGLVGWAIYSDYVEKHTK